MRRAFLVVAVVVAAAGNLVHAEPSPEVRGRVGVDGMAGVGMILLIGGMVRVEQPVAESSVLTLRVGHLQYQSIESESRELYPLYLGHVGFRFYGGPLYAAVEGGVFAVSDYRGWHVSESGAVVLGAKPSSVPVDIGVSAMLFAGGGLSLCAHLGVDFASW